MTLATVLTTIPLLFPNGTRSRHLFHVAGTDEEMCKLFISKKTLYDSSTVAQIAALPAEYCIVGIPHNTAI